MKKMMLKTFGCLCIGLLAVTSVQAETAQLASLDIEQKSAGSNSSYLDEINAEVNNTNVYRKKVSMNDSDVSTSTKKVLTTQEMIQRLKKLSLTH